MSDYKAKDGVEIVVSDFWYDLAYGGYLKPEDILEHREDANEVKNAVIIIKKFQDLCESIGEVV